MSRYDDILHKDRPASKHPKMDLGNRAKIFAPFSALRGFDIALITKAKEKALVSRAWLSDDMQNILERKLNQLAAGDMVTVTYFSLQKRIGDYEMGNYFTVTGSVEEIDQLNRALVLSCAFVPFIDIFDLQGGVFDHADGESEEAICGGSGDTSD